MTRQTFQEDQKVEVRYRAGPWQQATVVNEAYFAGGYEVLVQSTSSGNLGDTFFGRRWIRNDRRLIRPAPVEVPV